MARKRKQNVSFLDTLMGAPWQVSVVVGIGVFIGLKWILPYIGASNMFIKPIAQALSGMAWLFSGFFFLIGALVFVKTTASIRKQASGKFMVGGTAPASSSQPPSWAKYAANGRTEPGIDENPVKRGPLREPLEDSAVVGSVERPAIIDPLSEIKSLHHRREPLGVPPEDPSEWSIDLIREIEWKRFEDVCQKFYETKGIGSETTALGADGGIDIRLYQDSSGQATSIVQCKSWGERIVGVKPVRELLGVMTHERIGKAFFMTSGQFSSDAKEVAKSNCITLIDGEMLLMMIKRLPEADQRSLLSFAIEGDYKTPTCPACGIKMKRISGKAGRPDFWGCHNYRRCRQTLGVRRNA